MCRFVTWRAFIFRCFFNIWPCLFCTYPLYFFAFFLQKKRKMKSFIFIVFTKEMYTFDIFSASSMSFWAKWTDFRWKLIMESRFREKSVIFLVFFDFLPREVWLGGTHVCLGETHVCLGETHVCLWETHVCLWGTILVLYPFFSLPVFFSTLFFLGLAYVLSKSPFSPL